MLKIYLNLTCVSAAKKLILKKIDIKSPFFYLYKLNL